MRQADLPGLGMAALGAVEVGDPDGRAVSGHHLGDDTRAPAMADHVDHHLVVLEHPVPGVTAIDAHAGLICIVAIEPEVTLNCTRFLWTRICLAGERHGEGE